jgi:hypothetical protein
VLKGLHGRERNRGIKAKDGRNLFPNIGIAIGEVTETL